MLLTVHPHSDCSHSTWAVTIEGSLLLDRKTSKYLERFFPLLHTIVANYLALVWKHLTPTGNLLEAHAWGLHVIICVDHVLASLQMFICDSRESCSVLVNLFVNICKQCTVCKWLLAPKNVFWWMSHGPKKFQPVCTLAGPFPNPTFFKGFEKETKSFWHC